MSSSSSSTCSSSCPSSGSLLDSLDEEDSDVVTGISLGLIGDWTLLGGSSSDVVVYC